MERAPRIRRHPRARRIKLRVDPVTGDAVVTLPPRVPEADGLRFVQHHRDWLAERRAALPAAIPLQPGVTVPLYGQDHVIDHRPDLIGCHHDVQRRCIVAGGPVENLDRRLEGWLRAQARRLLIRRAAYFAELVGQTVNRVRIGDPTSRWGSCSSTGTLSLSWRLVFAPRFVSDYVVAHEVAHLVELNHSPRFWRVVDTLVGDPRQARDWLKRNGAALHRIGR
ncbi:MAG: M48 family peptidase [Alphaproteobacteria bacterium]|nr:MAG: M48 family peptidase [Alphaproteobacteria bacterium]